MYYSEQIELILNKDLHAFECWFHQQVGKKGEGGFIRKHPGCQHD